MSHLLHNRRRFYETLLPRIPDPKIRSALEQINQLPDASHLLNSEVISSSMSLLALDLEDIVKKPGHGEKQGKVVLSLSEALDKAVRIEELCYMICAGADGVDLHQINDSIVLRISRLRKLADDIRYHRIRLID